METFLICAAVAVGVAIPAYCIGRARHAGWVIKQIEAARDRVWERDDIRQLLFMAQKRYWYRDGGRGGKMRPRLPSEQPWLDVENALRLAAKRELDRLWDTVAWGEEPEDE